VININFSIGIIGHRNLSFQDGGLFVQQCCYKILKIIRSKYFKVRAISAMSEGADTIFAESAISLNIQLESVIPFCKFESDFVSVIPKERYKVLMRKSDIKTYINFTERDELAYKKSMEWIVFNSNIILAVWDGKKVGGLGSTWKTILLCEIVNKPLIHIDILNKRMNLYINDGNPYFYRRNITEKNINRIL
jgi:hypothetical protein